MKITSTLFLLSIGFTVFGKPNVLIIMTDDQGYPEISAHGNPVLQTPNLDRLHGQSLRLSDYHVAPMCTPTRGQLLTGLDAARNGAVNVSSGRALIRQEVPIMANYFGDAGYSTGVFGKWHLGGKLSLPSTGPRFSGKCLVSFLFHPIGSCLLGERLL